MTPYERRSELITKAISDRGMTICGFATRVDMSRQSLYEIMNGHSRGSAESLLKIADALSLNVRDLMVPLSQPRVTERSRRLVMLEPLNTIQRNRLIEAVAGTKYEVAMQQCHEILYGPSSDLAEQLRINLGLLHRSLYRRPEEPADTPDATTT